MLRLLRFMVRENFHPWNCEEGKEICASSAVTLHTAKVMATVHKCLVKMEKASYVHNRMLWVRDHIHITFITVYYSINILLSIILLISYCTCYKLSFIIGVCVCVCVYIYIYIYIIHGFRDPMGVLEHIPPSPRLQGGDKVIIFINRHHQT